MAKLLFSHFTIFATRLQKTTVFYFLFLEVAKKTEWGNCAINDLRNSTTELCQLLYRGKAAITITLYVSSFRRFLSWCDQNGLKSLPYNESTVSLFLMSAGADLTSAGLGADDSRFAESGLTCEKKIIFF